MPYSHETYEKKILTGLIFFLILSILDGAFTLWGLRLGVIEEANPLMRWIIDKSIVGFVAIKLSLPVLMGIVFWRIRETSRKLVAYSLSLMLFIYSMVDMFHVYWIWEKWSGITKGWYLYD